MMRIAVIAAMEQELRPLVQGWNRRELPLAKSKLMVHERDEVVACAAGMGKARAESASKAIVAEYKPALLISAGLAGALVSTLKVGSVVTPNVVVDSETGVEYRVQTGVGVIGGGVLVTASEVSGSLAKRTLVDNFHALLVDMEAAGVARAAADARAGFLCVKAISDEAEFEMPPLQKFVSAAGEFETGSFLRWLSIRPGWWLATLKLARNSKVAAAALCERLRTELERKSRAEGVGTLEGIEPLRN